MSMRTWMIGIGSVAGLGMIGVTLRGEASAPIRFVAAAPPVSVGSIAETPVLADLDGDGDLDVVVGCSPVGTDGGGLQVLRNDGSGRLVPVGAARPLGATAAGCAVGDVDGDGVPDIVAYEHSSYDLAIMAGRGDGTFGPAVRVAMHDGSSPHVHSVVLADVNADGHLDVLASLVDDHALAVLLGDGRGGFTPAHAQPYFAHRHPYMQLNPVDIDGDGHLDVVLTDVRGNGLTVLAGSGTGMFASTNFRLDTHTPLRAAERPLACALADVDGDGDLDAVAFIDESPQAVVALNDGTGRFVEPDASLIALAAPCVGGVVTDVTGDGHADIVASTTMASVVSINPGRGDGTFARAFTVESGGRSAAVAVGDMNGDGRPDLVVGHFHGGTVAVLLAQPVTD